MSRPFVVAVGELLWDLLPGGRQLGGAPGNVVTHARSLGADVALVSRVGRDSSGSPHLGQTHSQPRPRSCSSARGGGAVAPCSAHSYSPSP